MLSNGDTACRFVTTLGRHRPFSATKLTAPERIDNLRAVDRAFMPRPRWQDGAWLGLALGVHATAWLLGTRPVALDPDPMNLAYGMQRFDITHFNPHPPGYLVYVWTLKAVHALSGRGASLPERFATVQLVSLLFGLAAIVVVFAAAKRLRLSTSAAGWAALLMALHPILVFHAIDGQTHTSEAFASGLLLHGAIAYRDRPDWRRAIWLGVVVAFGASLRPSFVIFGIPVVIWTVGFQRFADLAMAGVASLAGAVAWLVPTVHVSGGWDTWRAATRGLVHQGFVLTSSPFSDTAVASLIWANQLSLALWAFETILPLLVAWAVAYAARRGRRNAAETDRRWLVGVLLIGGGAAIAYYSATFISEPGYLAALLPPVALLVGWLTAGGASGRPAAMAVAAALLCWWMPELPHVLKVPSMAEWRRRTTLAMTYARHVDGALPPGGRYLALVGHPDITVGRQLPMLSPRVDALLIHDGRRPWFVRSSLTYITEADTTPIPEAFGPSGAGASLATSRRYEGIYFDGSLAPHFQVQLANASSCPVPRATDITQTVLLPSECLPRQSVVIDGLELRFGVERAPPR